MSAYTQKDYGAIEAALTESPRGRWFLDEYIRRNRGDETNMLLEAIRKLERGLVENSAIANSPQGLSEELAAALHSLSESIDSTLAGITLGEEGGGAMDEALIRQVRGTAEQLATVRRQIGELLNESEAPDDGDEPTADDFRFFEGDEDLFEPSQAAAPPSLVVMNEERGREGGEAAGPKPDLKPESRGDPMDRIVFIRRRSSEETSIPLADEAEDKAADRSRSGS